MKKIKSKKGKEKNDWNTPDGRRSIVRAVFQHLRDNPDDIGQILDCRKTRAIVEKVGNTEIPPDVIAVCVPFGDSNKPPHPKPGEKGAGGSLYLEIPPDELDINETPILRYSCTYPLWGGRYKKKAPKRR